MWGRFGALRLRGCAGAGQCCGVRTFGLKNLVSKINTGFSFKRPGGSKKTLIHHGETVTGCADISGVKNPRPKIPTACTPQVVAGGMGDPGGCSGALRYGVAPIGINKHDLFG